MEKKKYNNIGRGEFLARLGAGSALTVAALAGCKPSSMKFDPYDVDDDDVPTDKMEYRTNPNTGDNGILFLLFFFTSLYILIKYGFSRSNAFTFL